MQFLPCEYSLTRKVTHSYCIAHVVTADHKPCTVYTYSSWPWPLFAIIKLFNISGKTKKGTIQWFSKHPLQPRPDFYPHVAAGLCFAVPAPSLADQLCVVLAGHLRDREGHRYSVGGFSSVFVVFLCAVDAPAEFVGLSLVHNFGVYTQKSAPTTKTVASTAKPEVF